MTPGDPQFNPFPGLRPFDMEDEYLFFGRESQRKELVALLREQRFIAVLGTSGSGKSSLVRAGLLPALCGGVMTRAGSNWKIAVMRPGGHAITNLANALYKTDLLDNEGCEDLTELDIEATLIRSGLGLIEAARQLGLKQNENLLIVVDQFEELFRFNSSKSDRGSRDEAAAFVKILVEAARQLDLSIYVVLTMRSDFFGDCSQFEELAEAVNKGEYLVPRLSRENKKTAIEGPVRVGGSEIAPRLVQRLLNDLGDDPDQLPILQHALMRTWNQWLTDHKEGESLDLRHYEATGGMDQALSRHADEVLSEADSKEETELTKHLFQALTEKGPDNRGIRRPTSIEELCAITAAEKNDVIQIIDRFRKPGRTFLMPPVEIKLAADTVIDISHESLMRVWENLGRWVDDEAQSARIYRRLAETAQLYADDKASLYHDPDLQIALSWQENESPTEAWGARYQSDYAQTIRFLEQSHEIKLKKERENEATRKRELEQAKRLAKAEQENAANQQKLAVAQKKRARLAIAVAALAVIATAFAGFAWQKAKESEGFAKKSEDKAILAWQSAKESEELARKSEDKAILSLVLDNQQEITTQDVLNAERILLEKGESLTTLADSMEKKADNYERNGDLKSALVAYKALKRLRPNNPLPYLFSGRVYLKLGKTKQAIQDVTKFSTLDLNTGDISFGRGVRWMLGAALLAEAGDLEKYTEYSQRSLDKFSEQRHEVLVKGCLILETDRKLTRAAHAYTMEAMASYTENVFPFNWGAFTAGLAEHRVGNFEKAEFWCQKSLSKIPENKIELLAMNNAVLSLTYGKTGKRDEGDSCYKTAKLHYESLKRLDKVNAFHNVLLVGLLLREYEQQILRD